MRDEEWVNLPTYQIDLEVTSKYRDKRLKTIKPSTFKREYALIKHCARVSKALGFDGVNVDVFNNLPIPQIFDRPIYRITDEDIDKILFVAGSGRFRNRYMPPVIKLAVDTGMRRGELVSIVWSEVDWKKKLINLPAHKTKSGQARQVAFTMRGYDALLDLHHLAIKPYKTKDVPPRNGPNEPVVPLTGNAIRCAFEHIRESAGFQKCTFTTFATKRLAVCMKRDSLSLRL